MRRMRFSFTTFAAEKFLFRIINIKKRKKLISHFQLPIFNFPFHFSFPILRSPLLGASIFHTYPLSQPCPVSFYF